MGGRQPSTVSTPDELRAASASQGGDATMAPSGLTFGKMVDGGKVGKFAAEYHKVVGLAATTTYRIPHALGFIPAWCMLVAYDNPSNPATVLVAGPNEYDKWSDSEVRVRVYANLGAIQGAVMWFIVGGER